jgi:hypothetical protein
MTREYKLILLEHVIRECNYLLRIFPNITFLCTKLSKLSPTTKIIHSIVMETNRVNFPELKDPEEYPVYYGFDNYFVSMYELDKPKPDPDCPHPGAVVRSPFWIDIRKELVVLIKEEATKLHHQLKTRNEKNL